MSHVAVDSTEWSILKGERDDGAHLAGGGSRYRTSDLLPFQAQVLGLPPTYFGTIVLTFPSFFTASLAGQACPPPATSSHLVPPKAPVSSV